MGRPIYEDFGSVEDVPARFDLVEIKLDGMYCECLIDAKGRVKLRNRWGATFEERQIKRWPKELGCVVMAGEFIKGTQRSLTDPDRMRLVCFDVMIAGSTSLEEDTLAERRGTLERVFAWIDSSGADCDWLALHTQSPREDAQNLWRFRVENGNDEGLVFKSSRGYWGQDWARVKRRVTQDYVLLKVEPRKNNRITLVGGVYKGGELKEVAYVFSGVPADLAIGVGEVFEASGNQLFKSGALRHPRFERVRPDKPAIECRINGGKEQ